LVNDIEDLQEIWDTLDTCFDGSEKYIAEALDPIVKFRKYRVFDNGAIREFYSCWGRGRWASCTVLSMTRHYSASWLGCCWAIGSSGPRRCGSAV
jgi:hypothetical protein